MPKPHMEAAAPYENLHLVTRDYLDHIRDLLSIMQQPNTPTIGWRDVHTLAEVNARLAEAAGLLERLTTSVR